ncbi:RdgB/HAM1 family non-canonical purine NTP pyrophosphatase [Riemerella columbina]|uniref:RdgB/HAM1 family non-canonical purine NTP pyrophosphatase n=1 Tax=Riemerella columbina TaxID=103810 RepID=UPI00266F454F|nr:RdgB/HAM1 family non-canonical purine NTP pyrophosphatase [Riemerella columbina]WKS94542.1 RdgB/HAM1 family non-canonical purine NTP pyrophosphatase [Riemerella columbina]
MAKEILIATHNEHKKAEIQQILGSDFEVKSLTDYQLYDEIVEDGQSFEENALIKAKYCFEKTGLLSIGDDSGLVVEALDGRPGIYSARYAGDHNFEANIAKVLEEMKGIDHRKAYFITVLCAIDSSGIQYFEGRVEGQILNEHLGHQGFGYDPIFVPEGYTKTFAEMAPEEKNAISHRRRALDKLLRNLE